jgi:hypothetical protein
MQLLWARLQVGRSATGTSAATIAQALPASPSRQNRTFHLRSNESPMRRLNYRAFMQLLYYVR